MLLSSADKTRNQKWIVGFTIAACLCVSTSMVNGAPPRVAKRVEATSKSHKLVPVLRIARQSQEALRGVKDYEAIFSKKELVGKQIISQKMRIKLREAPFSVYLGYQAPHEGREVIYVDGRNKGDLLVHDTGIKSLIGTIGLSPTGSRAMEENRYPITNIGISNMLALTIERWESELKYDEIDVKYYPNAKIGNVDCKVIQTSHPVPRRHFKFHMSRLYIDKKTNIPVRVEQYAWPTQSGGKPMLVEEYTYMNVKPNVNLTDRDFDANNPAYGF